MASLKKIHIDNSDIYLEDLGEGKGKITISDTYDHNYSYFWGAMGDTLEGFLCSCNKEYFASKLMGSRRDTEMDVPKTFAAIRKYIREELDLPWYRHMEFQQDMRQRLKEFQSQMEELPSADLFVALFFPSFVDRLEYWLIEDRIDRTGIERDFRNISEHWYFIVDKPSREYLWLEKMHGKLKQALLAHVSPRAYSL